MNKNSKSRNCKIHDCHFPCLYISCLRGKVEHAEFLVVSDDCVIPASGNIIS